MSNYRRWQVKGGLYFFTINLEDRSQDYLVRYIDILRFAYKATRTRHPFDTIAICILPNHIHWIMQLPENDMNFSIRIAYFKTLFSRNLPIECRNINQSKGKKREAGIWQRRFWEHLIRDEEDLINHIHYTYYNPIKHGYVKAVKDWQFSSFHQDVKNGLFLQDWYG